MKEDKKHRFRKILIKIIFSSTIVVFITPLKFFSILNIKMIYWYVKASLLELASQLSFLLEIEWRMTKTPPSRLCFDFIPIDSVQEFLLWAKFMSEGFFKGSMSKNASVKVRLYGLQNPSFCIRRSLSAKPNLIFKCVILTF